MLNDNLDIEFIARVANYAYRNSTNKDNAISLMHHYLPEHALDVSRAMWEAIDAYEDNNMEGFGVFKH